jgi:hypothetical protein
MGIYVLVGVFFHELNKNTFGVFSTLGLHCRLESHVGPDGRLIGELTCGVEGWSWLFVEGRVAWC